MEFIDYFKNKEASLIKIIGENDWRDNKVYFVDEIEAFVSDWQEKEAASFSEQIKCFEAVEFYATRLVKDTEGALTGSPPSRRELIRAVEALRKVLKR